MTTRPSRRRTFTLEVTLLTYSPGDALILELVHTLEKAARGVNGVTEATCHYYDTFEGLGPELNREKLIEVVQWVAGEHAKKELGMPSEWDQEWWYHRVVPEGVVVGSNPNWCGTAACLAGKVALMEGGTPSVSSHVGAVSDYVYMPDGEVRPARDVAMKALGLNEDQAEALFYGGNTFEDIVEIAKQILGGELYPSRSRGES